MSQGSDCSIRRSGDLFFWSGVAIWLGGLGMVLMVWVILCRMWFGYVLTWPPILPEITNISEVTNVTPLGTPWDGPDVGKLLLDEDDLRNSGGMSGWLTDQVAWSRRSSDTPWYRVFGRLANQGLVRPDITMHDSGAAAVIGDSVLASIDPLPTTNPPHALIWGAIVTEAVDVAGNPITLVTARGGGWGDTYPYYEAVFRGAASQIDLSTRLSHQVFYYDSAGIEGLEPYFQLALLVLLLIPSLVVLIAVTIFLRNLAKPRA